jgi:Carboxypeptidase regulatory-like domain
MERVGPFFASVIAGVLLFLPSATFSATTCIEVPLPKPIHQISGFVYFPSGDRITNAEVTVLQAGNEIAVQQTNKDGKFSFEQLRPGKYEIRVRVEHFVDAHSQVVLVNPKAQPREELAVLISLSGACSNISLVHTK